MLLFNVSLWHFHHHQTLNYTNDNVRPCDRKLFQGNKEGKLERGDDVLKGTESASKAPHSFLYFTRTLRGSRDVFLSLWDPNLTVASPLPILHFLIPGRTNVGLQAKKLTKMLMKISLSSLRGYTWDYKCFTSFPARCDNTK